MQPALTGPFCTDTMKRTLNLEEAIAAVLRSSESEKDSTSGNLSDNEEGKEFLPGSEELCSSSEEEEEEEDETRLKNGELMWSHL